MGRLIASSTVAALTDIESATVYTKLELDINDEPNLPSGFYWR